MSQACCDHFGDPFVQVLACKLLPSQKSPRKPLHIWHQYKLRSVHYVLRTEIDRLNGAALEKRTHIIHRALEVELLVLYAVHGGDFRGVTLCNRCEAETHSCSASR